MSNVTSIDKRVVRDKKGGTSGTIVELVGFESSSPKISICRFFEKDGEKNYTPRIYLPLRSIDYLCRMLGDLKDKYDKLYPYPSLGDIDVKSE